MSAELYHEHPRRAKVNTLDNFAFVFSKRIDDLFVDRMDLDEAFTARFLNDPDFKKVVFALLMKQVYERIRAEAGIKG